MFEDCSELLSLRIDTFNTKKVLEMDEMFSGVINLRNLDLSSFDTRNISSWVRMWHLITNMNIRISVSRNKKILGDIGEGINITDIDND